MVTKLTNANTCIKVAYITNIVCLIHVSITVVAILSKPRHKFVNSKTFVISSLAHLPKDGHERGRNMFHSVTGMALAHCILGKFLGVVSPCFPPPLDVPTFAPRCLYVRKDARDPSSERWNCGPDIWLVILLQFRLPYKFRDPLNAANLVHETGGFTSLRRKAWWGDISP